MSKYTYPGERITTNGNQLVATHVEARIADCGIFYPITPSTEQGENFEMSVAQGNLNVFGDEVKAIETEGEHAAQGGAIAFSVTGKRVSNFTSGQGIAYALEQYFHAPGKLSTMVLNIGARALTKHALNVHCGHDDIIAAMPCGWTMLMAMDAQQAADQAIILRRVTELSLTPGMNIQDGFLTTHLERTFLRAESELLRQFLGRPDDIIKTPNKDQEELFGPQRRRVPQMYDLQKPLLMGSVQNQEHYMTGVIARKSAFNDHILSFLEEAYADFAQLTGREYGLLSQYNCENADTVFLSLGSSAENIQAAVDYIQETHKEKVGIMHLNCLRPFPQNAIINALRGRKNVIILERVDEPNSGVNPIARDIRAAIACAQENSKVQAHAHLDTLKTDEVPRIFEGIYGLGSRDFRPEGILGAYEFVTGKGKRFDGKSASEGASSFYIGVNHPHSVISKERPSLLPKSAIAIRLHSIGGWGAITTGKNMAEIMGELGTKANNTLHISANPKYGSEKKGAPTSYYLAVADERIRTNCELKHVDVVLCCDPKIFTHSNPLQGLKDQGIFIWESDQAPAISWQRIPPHYRQQIVDKQIQLFSLSGFEIARNLTPVKDLQTRMQGNTFLGAFFKISSFLGDYKISIDSFLETVLNQYNRKFGKFGDKIVNSNMEVMKAGLEKVIPIPYGQIDETDLSARKGQIITPLSDIPCPVQKSAPENKTQGTATESITSLANYQKQFGGDMDMQPATSFTSLGVMPMATGATNSKFVSRIQVPVYDPYKCTQCMACIEVCPDTALPNTAQDIDSLLATIFNNYVSDERDRSQLMENRGNTAQKIRVVINQDIKNKNENPISFAKLVLQSVENASDQSKKEISKITDYLPLGYGKARPIFQMLEKKTPGEGGLFTIFVSDLCKGCGECVVACGDHEALKMVEETDEIRGKHLSANNFFNLLPQTPQKYLGKFDPNNMEESRAAILYNHLLIQDNYNAFVSGDGACAGCGEKSVLRGIVSMTESYMRAIYESKRERLNKLLNNLDLNSFNSIKSKSVDSYENIKLALLHLIMGFGAENMKATHQRIKKEFKGSDQDLIDALKLVIKTDIKNHAQLKVIDGEYQGMAVMGMTANTGCNTVYGSTHPSNPHKYPWMNSLFQDGTTIGWLVAESFISTHSRRSIIPERIAQAIANQTTTFSTADYENLIYFDDSQMSETEVAELPKVWAVGGDGGIGDIGFQNLSKVVLQNRPNMQVLMLDTQVYSNTGGQNSDSSVGPGGFDMNQFGKRSQGKMTERKEVALAMTAGHGSPFVASVSFASTAKFYKAVLDGLSYRGTAYIQAFTSCQPEHGIADDVSQVQALAARDSRCVPEFVFSPQNGETESEAFDIKGNSRSSRDWLEKKDKKGNKYEYTILNWALSENRFRKHFSPFKESDSTVNFFDLILRMGQKDIVNRDFLNPTHRSYIPLNGIYADIVTTDGEIKRINVSRQMVIFTIERRKNWRMLQSRANIINNDYLAQKDLIADFDEGKIDRDKFFNNTLELFNQYLEKKQVNG